MNGMNEGKDMSAMMNNNREGMLGMGKGGMDMPMMQMTFYASKTVTLFFEGWKTTTAGEMFGTCVALIVLGILYEGLKVARQVLLLRANQDNATKVFLTHDIDSDPVSKSHHSPARKNHFLSLQHILQTFLHMLQVFIGYLLMLAFMTYNAWVCLAVILGAGAGYLLFAWKVPSFQSSGDHCN